MNKMKNRVYGVVGIKSILANWNSDFTGKPRSTSNGDIYGSDKAFKYPIKKMWESNGEKVLYIKSYKNDKNDIGARTLAERYNMLFEKDIKKIKDKEEVIKDLFSAMDVQNFGATFAEKGNNISITGCVQVGQGYNKYEDTNIEIIDILSPFIDSKSKDKNKSEEKNQDEDKKPKNTSIGKKIISDEAHYMYPFSVNPQNYDIYTEIIDGLEGYTKEAYENFKRGCLVAATAYNTNSKAGCENEFALFVECKEGSKLYLANLDQYIEFRKENKETSIIDITKISKLLSEEDIKNEISKVEVYYNKYTTKLEGLEDDYIINNIF